MKKCPHCKGHNITFSHNLKNGEITYKCNSCKKHFHKDKDEEDKYVRKHKKKDIDEDKKLLLSFYRARRGL